MKSPELSLRRSRPRSIAPVEEQRARLREQPDVNFVRLEEFLRLLVGPSKLERFDAPGARLRGLHDPERCLTFVIEEEALLETRAG